MQPVRIYEIPVCKMVSSGIGFFGEETFERFKQWFSSQPMEIFPKDFLFWDDQGGKGPGGLHWLYLYTRGVEPPKEFPIVDFKGGLYAVATDIDQKTDTETMKREVNAFLAKTGFERDPSRPELGNIITPPLAFQVMGYEQMDYYTPIKPKTVMVDSPNSSCLVK